MDGVKLDPDKLRAIMEWPTPINTRQVQLFLGLAGYYRRFISKYAQIAKPLIELLRKNEHFRWTEDVD